jgi:mRNA deadenylase 3'-5' endonuclease subunit Ccr4
MAAQDSMDKMDNIDKIDMEVMSWNVLSDALAALMTHYPPAVMEDRWSRIAPILHRAMDGRQRIVCLQEVAETTVPFLFHVAESHDYRVLYDSWGTAFNGRMGNAILVPPSLDIVAKNRIRLGAEALMPTAKTFAQTVTSAVLQHHVTGRRFVVATVHMPCRYKTPEVMKELHSTLHRMMELSHYPTLVAGDFNSKPEEMPVHDKIGSLWDHTPITPTIHSKVHPDQPDFLGCIDHILYTKSSVQWLETIMDTEHLDIHNTLLPSLEHPSDHVPIMGRFRL